MSRPSGSAVPFGGSDNRSSQQRLNEEPFFSRVLSLIDRSNANQSKSNVRFGGHEQTSASRSEMSALPPKADMFSVEIDVCFVPIADPADRHRVRKTAVEHLGQLRDALKLVVAAGLPPMGSARA